MNNYNEILLQDLKPSCTERRPLSTSRKICVNLVVCSAVIIFWPPIVYIISSQISQPEFGIFVTVRRINGENKSETEHIEINQDPVEPILLVENYFRIKTREEWGAVSANGNLSEFKFRPKNIIICETGIQHCDDFTSCKREVLLVQQVFMQLKNVDDIGYNYLIGGDGAIYEGIGWHYIGCHKKGFNENSIGIAFIGNYQYIQPSENQLSAAKLLIEYGLENHKIMENYRLMGQRDVLPGHRNPGDILYNRIMAWKHYAKK